MEQNEELDLAKVQDFIRGQMAEIAPDLIKGEIERIAPRPTQQQQQHVPSQEELAQRQLHDVLQPFIRPEIDSVKLDTADAIDKVSFYTDSERSAEYKAEETVIETMFKQLKDAGRPLPRRDIYDYLQGKLAREKPEEFEKKTAERRKKQVDNVSGSVDMGFGALERAKNDPVWSNVTNMSLDELEKAMDGVTF